jgi:hypothetical protein
MVTFTCRLRRRIIHTIIACEHVVLQFLAKFALTLLMFVCSEELGTLLTMIACSSHPRVEVSQLSENA